MGKGGKADQRMKMKTTAKKETRKDFFHTKELQCHPGLELRFDFCSYTLVAALWVHSCAGVDIVAVVSTLCFYPSLQRVQEQYEGSYFFALLSPVPPQPQVLWPFRPDTAKSNKQKIFALCLEFIFC